VKPYKEVFMLSVFGGFSLKDISLIFGKSESWGKDLIPLYIDGCCSEETAMLVTEPLEHCKACSLSLFVQYEPVELSSYLCYT
jgi:hypothetical protein